MNLSQRIKIARQEAGYRTQNEFAVAVGVTRETLAKYESKPNSVTLDAARSVASSTKKPLAWFFLEPGQRIVSESDLEFNRDAALASIRRGLEWLESLEPQKPASPEPEAPKPASPMVDSIQRDKPGQWRGTRAKKNGKKADGQQK